MDLNVKSDRTIYEIEQYLILTGASDYVHYFLRFNYDKIRSGEITMILAPLNTAMKRLVEKAGKSLDEISNLSEGKDVLTNFLSSTPFAREYPVYKAINGTTFGKTVDDLFKLKRSSTNVIDDIIVGTMDAIIQRNEKQMQALILASPPLNFAPRSGIIGHDPVTQFDVFSNPLIRMIALNLSLTDIVNNCRVGLIFNATTCNNEIFWQEKVRMDFPEHMYMINKDWKKAYRALSKRL